VTAWPPPAAIIRPRTRRRKPSARWRLRTRARRRSRTLPGHDADRRSRGHRAPGHRLPADRRRPRNPVAYACSCTRDAPWRPSPSSTAASSKK
jgi:hypothetical protein